MILKVVIVGKRDVFGCTYVLKKEYGQREVKNGSQQNVTQTVMNIYTLQCDLMFI